jgi:predicted peroxiredoxin
MGAKSIIALQMTGVYLALKRFAEHVHAAGLPPLQELVDIYVQEGGTIWVCSPCMKARKIKVADLIPGTKVVTAVTLVEAFIAAKNMMVH